MAEQAAADAITPSRPQPTARHEFEAPELNLRPQNPNAPALSQWPPLASQDVAGPRPSVPFVLANVEGPDLTDSSFVPPDSMGDVGPTQYIVALNGRIRSYNKTTLVADGVLDVTSDTFFNSVRNSATAVDPRIRFDRQTSRWFVVYISAAVPNRFLIAFSDTAAITASTTWSYTFFSDTVVNGSGQSCLGDYETLGIDANALYMGTNEFCGATLGTVSYFGSAEYVIPKATLIAGAGTSAAFVTTLSTTPQGVDNYDASPALGYFVGLDRVSFGVLHLSQISNPSTPSPSRTARSITVATTSAPRSVPHAGGAPKNLDAIGDRLINAVARNGSIWTAHAICVDTSGVAVPSSDTVCRNGVRWYELSNLTTAPTVNQLGTIFDPAAINPRHYWVPSVNVNSQGVVVFGFASAGADTFAGAAYAQREQTDPLGTTQSTVQHLGGAFAYYTLFETTATYRWGDYSMVSVDPSDDTTFWTIQQYGKAQETWGTRVTRLTPPAGGAAPTISNIANQATNEDIAVGPVAFAVTDGDTPAGSLALSAVSSNPAVAPLANIVFGGAGESRNVTVTPAGNASGLTTITVTVSDGTLTASDTFDLTVEAVNDSPTVSDVTNQSIAEDTTLGPVAFGIGDIETAAGSLIVTAFSSNTTLVPLSGLTLGGSGGSRTVSVTPAANQSGATTITLSVSDGVLTAIDTFELMVAAINDSPTVSDVTNQSIAEDTTLGPVAFGIGDFETAAGSLIVTASSSNTTLVPLSGLTLGGSGGSRTVSVTPAANQSGATTITLSVSDGVLTAIDTFELTVTPVDDVPTIGDVANQVLLEDQMLGPLSFAVGDAETASGTLIVSASSSNITVVPTSGVALGGSGGTRTVTITPAANQSGATTVTLIISDGVLSASDTFLVTVNPVNDPPTIAAIADQSVQQDETVAPFPLTIGDIDSPEGAIVVSAIAGSATLLPPGGIAVAGTGFNRTLSLTPATGQNGSTTVTVSVSDGAAFSSTNFTLTVHRATGPPSAPTNFLATLIGTTLMLSWDLPSAGSAPADYILQAAIDANFAVIVFDQPTGSAARTMTVPNVPNGVFHLRVRARNTFGTGPASNVQQVGEPPDAPTNFFATLSGTTLTMTWAPPASGTSAADYLLEAALNPSFSPVIYSLGTGSAVTSLVIPGVPQGTFFLRLRARNGSGVSAPSNIQAIGPGGCTAAPEPATGFSITRLGGPSVRLAWTAPSGSNPATDYVVQAALEQSFGAILVNQALGSRATAFDAMAPPGTFFVRIVATNVCGSAAPSDVVRLVLP